MPKPRTLTGEKNLIGARVVTLRKKNRLSQRELASKLQLLGMDMDKNVITRIETGKRAVTDFEILALVKVFDVSYEYLLEGRQ